MCRPGGHPLRWGYSCGGLLIEPGGPATDHSLDIEQVSDTPLDDRRSEHTGTRYAALHDVALLYDVDNAFHQQADAAFALGKDEYGEQPVRCVGKLCQLDEGEDLSPVL